MGLITDKGALTFSIADYVILFLMLLISAAIGIYYALSGGKQRTAGEFLMGNRQIPTIPVGMSLVASFMSAITYLGAPADVYFNGSMYVWFAVSHVIACLFVGKTFIPVFYRLQLTSVYEYLELRFNKAVRRCGLAAFYVNIALYLGIVIYAPCLAFSAVTGVSFLAAIFSISLVCIFYTTLGGMKAVIWADFFQMTVIIVGMVSFIIKGSVINGGLQAVWNISEHGQRIEFFNADPDPTVRHTIWSMVIGGTVLYTGIHGLSQYQVQRYLSCSSIKSCYGTDPDPTTRHTIWSVLIGGVFLTIGFHGLSQYQVQRYLSCTSMKSVYWALTIYAVGCVVVVTILPTLCGLIAYAHFYDCDPLQSGKITRGDQILVYLVLDLFSDLPGLPGLFLSAVFSAALSTFSSALNALAAVTGEDVIKSIWPNISEKKYAIVLKCLAVIFGFFAIGMVFIADALGKILQTALALSGAFGGPMLGMFCLGVFNPKANSKGTVVGFLAGITFGFWIVIGSQVYPPESSALPLSTAGCVYETENVTELMTTELSTTSMVTESFNVTDVLLTENTYRPAIASLYSISYLWYSVITSFITILVGSLLSLVIGTQIPPDPELLCPLSEVFCPCFGWFQREEQKKPKKLSNEYCEAEIMALRPHPTETPM